MSCESLHLPATHVISRDTLLLSNLLLSRESGLRDCTRGQNKHINTEVAALQDTFETVPREHTSNQPFYGNF